MEQELQQLREKIERLQSENKQLQDKQGMNTVVVHETEETQQPTQQQKQDETVIFSDGNSYYVRTEWKNKSPLLSQGGIIYEDSGLFKKYVYPILKDESISSVDCDELHEINTIITLCKNYGLEISDKQIINISDSFNLQSEINGVRAILKDVKSIFHPQKKNRYEQFCEYWNKHVILLAKVNNNELYKELTSEQIVNSLVNLSYLELSKLNFKYNNIIFWFSTYLKKAINDKNFVDISEMNMKLNFTITGGITSMISDGVAFAQSILGMIPQKYQDKIGDIVMDKVKNIDIISKLLN